MHITILGARKGELKGVLKALEPMGLKCVPSEEQARGFTIEATVVGDCQINAFFTALEPFTISSIRIKGLGYEFEGKYVK